MEPRTVAIILTPAILARIDAVREKDGFTEEETIRLALITGLKKLDPDFDSPSFGKRGRPSNKDRESSDQNKNLALCDALGGTTVMRGDKLMCQYKMYSEMAGGIVSEAEIEEPVANLTQETVNNQYTDILGDRGEEAKERIIRIMRV